MARVGHRRSTLLLFTLLAALLATGCLPPRLAAVRPEVRAEGVARVTIQSVDRNEFVFMVWNETTLPITVDRDSVILVAPHFRRAWIRGTFSRRMVIVPPGGVHDVKMEFNLNDLKKGDEVQFDFSSALISQGQPVPIQPLSFLVEE